MFQRMIDKSMAKSPWIFHINAGSCNGCDIELVSVLTPRYDAERLGFRLTGTPRQADIVVVSGPVTSQTKDRLVRTLAQVPEPRVVVSLGSCPRSGNVFKGSYCVDGPLEKYTHVDKVHLIYCGGDDLIAAAREQWNDGSNTLCIAPGKIVVYQRNDVTNPILRDAGITVLEMPSAELSRGRGGPRCMSMPLIRAE